MNALKQSIYTTNQHNIKKFVAQYCAEHKIEVVFVHDSFCVEDKYVEQIVKALDERFNGKCEYLSKMVVDDLDWSKATAEKQN